MAPSPTLAIELLDPARFDEFYAYLNDHLADNGAPGAPYFQPLARANSSFPADQAERFCNALRIPAGEPGWRRLWVARAPGGQIAGHIDLRFHPEPCAGHRCLLGMGVERNHRRRGLGAGLIAHAAQWAVSNTALEWIDLQVLSVNAPAIKLYQAAGFIKTGEIPEMFKIDGQLLAYTGMSRRLNRPRQAG